MASRKFFSFQNGHSSQQEQEQTQTSNQNGNAMALAVEPRYDTKVVVPEMAFFCFDVLHKELHGLDGHVEPSNLGIRNLAL
jgi:hypothetical protein